MAVTSEQVATRLGRVLSSPETAQVQAWIADAEFLIRQRVDVVSLDEAKMQSLDYVVMQAVLMVAEAPKPGVVQETVTVDEASVSERYSRAARRVTILPEWWTLLGVGSGQAFSINMGRPLSLSAHKPWCSLMFLGDYCTCGIADGKTFYA